MIDNRTYHVGILRISMIYCWWICPFPVQITLDFLINTKLLISNTEQNPSFSSINYLGHSYQYQILDMLHRSKSDICYRNLHHSYQILIYIVLPVLDIWLLTTFVHFHCKSTLSSISIQGIRPRTPSFCVSSSCHQVPSISQRDSPLGNW